MIKHVILAEVIALYNYFLQHYAGAAGMADYGRVDVISVATA